MFWSQSFWLTRVGSLNPRTTSGGRAVTILLLQVTLRHRKRSGFVHLPLSLFLEGRTAHFLGTGASDHRHM